MKKLMIVAAMLALALATAVPAFAEQTSGNASFTADISNVMGNQCVQLINQQNTGNVENNADIEQNQVALQANVGIIVDAVDVIGGDNTINQTNTAEQNAEINQAGVVQVVGAELNCMQALTFK